MWESCPSGGCWILKVSRKEMVKAQVYWETLVMECMRGGFSQDIDGVLVSMKRHEVCLQIWMHEAAAAHSKCAEEIKFALGVHKLEMYLKYHKDSLHDQSTLMNSVLITC